MTQNHSLSQGDLATIERLVSRSADDIAISIGRSFERLEERIDAMESRTYARLSDIEDKILEAQERDE